MPTSCSRCRANINCNTIARPCKNKRKKTLKVIITRELESSIYIESVRNIFSVSPQWTKSGWVWFLIVAMSRRHLFDQLLLVLSWTIVNHCAGDPFLPWSSPDPPRLSLTLCQGVGGGGFVLAWVGVLIVVRKNAFQTHFTHELFSYTVCLIVKKNVISWYRYLISFLSKYSSHQEINCSRVLRGDRMSFNLKINQYQTKSTVCVCFFFLIPVSLVLFKLDFCIPVCMTNRLEQFQL